MKFASGASEAAEAAEDFSMMRGQCKIRYMILHCNTVLFRCQSTQCQISLILSGVNASRAGNVFGRSFPLPS